MSKATPTTYEFESTSSAETVAIGRKLAELLSPPHLLILRGDLGAGKTTLVKGIASALGAAEADEVTSPTFTLVHVFNHAVHNQAKVYHVDLYRVEQFRDLETLGIEDVLSEPAVIIIEWAERFSLLSDWPRVLVQLEHLEGDARRITVSEAPPEVPSGPPGAP